MHKDGYIISLQIYSHLVLEKEKELFFTQRVNQIIQTTWCLVPTYVESNIQGVVFGGVIIWRPD